MNLIVLAIPFFFLLIGVEILLARRRKLACYRFNDSIADLSCGIINQLLVVLVALVSIAVYGLIQQRFGIFEIDAGSPWMWGVCFLGVDFCYYWFHRASHQINFLWAAHVVHHQSEEYNLSVALRQSALQPAFSWAFYLPLAFLGFPLKMYLTLSALNTLYQFWIHTRLIARLGPLEHILNTPSHHRVHHGQNPKYIDKNHGGTLIVWDKLFGTFQVEEEEVVYGVTEPVNSWNPLWVNAHTWITTARRARSFDRLVDKVKVWLMPPGWMPAHLRTSKAWSERPKYDPPVRPPVIRYVLPQFTLAVAGVVTYLYLAKTAPIVVSAGLALGVATTLLSLGGLVEGRAWAQRLELYRPLLLAVGALALLPAARDPAAAATILLAAAGTAIWFRTLGTPSEQPIPARQP